MDVTATTPPTATTSASQSSSAGTSSDYMTFLKMLTTQLKNQDPMDPMDSKDFAVQLATFSGVEQQVKTNELLAAMSASLGAMGMADLASWIGREARVNASAWFDGAPITIAPHPAPKADSAVLVVKSASGTIVSQQDIAPEAGTIDWDGTDALGSPLPEGLYSFTLRSYQGDDLLATDTVDVYAEIVEARGGATGTMLILKGGVEVATSDVTALRSGS